MKRYIKSSIEDDGNRLLKDLQNMTYNYLSDIGLDNLSVSIDIDTDFEYDDGADYYSYQIMLGYDNSITRKDMPYIQKNFDYVEFCRMVNNLVEEKGFLIDSPCEHLQGSIGDFIVIAYRYE